jgi:hypothetical protein
MHTVSAPNHTFIASVGKSNRLIHDDSGDTRLRPWVTTKATANAATEMHPRRILIRCSSPVEISLDPLHEIPDLYAPGRALPKYISSQIA